MDFTGERVVPGKTPVDTLQQHYVRYLWALEFVQGKKVLDAACGTGYGTALMNLVADAKGIDISKEAIDFACGMYGDNYCEVNLEAVELLALNYEKDNAIVTFETIEHLENPVKFLTWCKDTAGMTVGSIPISCPTEYHKHVWNVPQIAKMLYEIGWTKLDLYYQDHMNIYPGIDRAENHGMILFKGER